jgi:YVTN family beta-propeller protein
MGTKTLTIMLGCAAAVAWTGCDEGDDVMMAADAAAAGGSGAPDAGPAQAQTLYVAHEGVLVSYDIGTGQERPGTVTNVAGPTDMQALDDGTVLVDLTGRGEILVLNGRTMLERGRIKSQAMGARPVHSYITPARAGKSYWMALDDGTDGMPATNAAVFIDLAPGSANYLKYAGEVGLGVGHHKATFSATTERVVISNISDCDNVLSVYDYANPAQIKMLATLTAKSAGWDGSSFPRTCDPTYKMGVPPAPHGCATSKVSNKGYCNLTGSGELVAIDIDATPPTFKLIPTHGSGGGYTKAHPDGRYVYSLEGDPREGNRDAPGAACQIGQLVVLDAMTDTIAKEVPILYKGAGCTSSIVGQPQETDEPAHMLVSHDKKTLYVTLAGGFEVAEARVDQQAVFDISDPANPVQKASIQVGTSSGYHGDTLSGDGKWLFIANNLDGTVTQIDTATNTVAVTIKVQDRPLTIATWGSVEGPSHQTGPLE